jgi:type III secretion protein U
MAKDESEEKTLPPSKKKLRDARQKGQVARSKDFTSGVALAGALGYLMLGGAAILVDSTAMFEKAADVAAGDFTLGLAALMPVIGHAAMQAVLPLLVLVPLLVVLSSIVMLQGIPFAIDPIAPKMEKINPAEGFKRLFQMRSLIELVKSLVKLALIVTAFCVILAYGLNMLVLTPSCGMDCVRSVFHRLSIPLFSTAAGLFVLAGMIDVGLQRWLFLRDQKMSFSEAKRERKDMDGDPHLRRERRRIMRDAVRLAGGLGLRRASVIVHDGGATTVGLRYKIHDMPAPVVVCRARGDRGRAMLFEAMQMKLPMAEDAELASNLCRVPLGHGIPERLFRSVALALSRAGTV